MYIYIYVLEYDISIQLYQFQPWPGRIWWAQWAGQPKTGEGWINGVFPSVVLRLCGWILGHEYDYYINVIIDFLMKTMDVGMTMIDNAGTMI